MLGIVLTTSVNLIPGSTIKYVAEPAPLPYKVVEAEVSAYTSSPDETWGDPFETASGARTRDGIIACPSRLEFGTKVEIEGKVYICEDRMAKRYRQGNYFDIWVENKEVAFAWGRKTVDVFIYE